MSFSKNLQRSRKYQSGVIIAFLVFVYLIHTIFFSSNSSSSSPLSNEEINDLLSGEDKASDIERESSPLHLLEPPYLRTDLKSQNWEINGDTLIKNNQYVRLTNEKKDQSSLIFNKHSFNYDGFEIEFKFSIHGRAKTNQLKGDGFALFLTDKPLGLGTVFGAEDQFNGLGIFFDTYRNAKRGPVFPYISVMNGDGHTPYDKDHDGKKNQLAGCTARNIYNSNYGASGARIIHTVEDGYLSLDYNIKGEWKNCFSIKDVHIPKERFLGFGAATGDLTEIVDLFEVEVFKLKQLGEVITSWRDFIEHIDEPETIEEDKNADDNPDYETDYKGRYRKRRTLRKNRNSQQRAKLKAKLRNKEKRYNVLKNQSQNYDESSFFSTLWSLIKRAILLLIIIFVVYVAVTFYRVKKRARRSRKTTGLLD